MSRGGRYAMVAMEELEDHEDDLTNNQDGHRRYSYANKGAALFCTILLVLAGCTVGGLVLYTTTPSSTASAANTGAHPVEVATPLGKLSGAHVGEFDEFLGVRYGDIAQRFMPSSVVQPWNTTLPATAYGPACWQPRINPSELPLTPFSEDCLYLNLWRPSNTSRSSKLGVLFWIHGGAYVDGAGSSSLYNGSRLAVEKNVVVVSINYRLGALGFAATEEQVVETGATGGMNGILDQIMALRFVRATAAAFGADASSITIFGESAGAISVCAMLVSPMAHGLYKHAVVQSGSCVSPLWRFHASTAGIKATSALMQRLGVTDLAGLRSIDPVSIIEAGAASGEASRELHVAPSHDGVVLPRTGDMDGNIEVLFTDPTHPLNAEALLIGSNTHDGVTTFHLTSDGGLVPNTTQPFDDVAFSRALSAQFGTNGYGLNSTAVAAIHTQYALDSAMFGGDVLSAFVRADGDLCVVCPTSRLASMVASRGVPTFLYLYGHLYAGDIAVGRNLLSTTHQGPHALRQAWASHASEIALVFGNARSYYWSGNLGSLTVPFNAVDKALSTTMRAYWATFAATGTPNPEGTSLWPPVPEDPDRPSVIAAMMLASGAALGPIYDYHTATCTFWATLYPPHGHT
jgi:para-nitrobenzyl esterase